MESGIPIEQAQAEARSIRDIAERASTENTIPIDSKLLDSISSQLDELQEKEPALYKLQMTYADARNELDAEFGGANPEQGLALRMLVNHKREDLESNFKEVLDPSKEFRINGAAILGMAIGSLQEEVSNRNIRPRTWGKLMSECVAANQLSRYLLAKKTASGV